MHFARMWNFYASCRRRQNPHTIKALLLLLLSAFSHVQLFLTLRTRATRLLCPWNSPGKNTGVGYHALLN